ncbi:MAG: site-2 protease family protein [Opitutales bacterium]
MTEIELGYAVIACLITAWLALPLHVAVHEFSHAIAARLLTASPISIQLGNQIHGVWRHGSLELSFGLTRWKTGSFKFSPHEFAPWKQALVIAAGPCGTFALTFLFMMGLLSANNTLQQIALLPPTIYGLKILILSLYPTEIKDRETGKTIESDGLKLSRIPWKAPSHANT